MKTLFHISFLGLAAIVWMGNPAQSRTGSRAQSGEQLSFSVDDEDVQRPIPLPPTIGRLLASDPAVKTRLQDERLSSNDLPNSWFQVSAVHLNGPAEKDIVVIGSGLLLGAKVTTFWIFRPKLSGFEMIFTASAHDLIIKQSRTAQYLDIETLAASGTRAC